MLNQLTCPITYQRACLRYPPWIATCTGARIGKKVSNSGETKVVVKATRSHSSMSENQTHLLLLTVFMVGQACLQYCNLDALQCVIGLVEVSRYRSFLPLITCLRCSLKRSANLRPVSPMQTVDEHLMHVKQSTTLSVMQEKCPLMLTCPLVVVLLWQMN